MGNSMGFRETVNITYVPICMEIILRVTTNTGAYKKVRMFTFWVAFLLCRTPLLTEDGIGKCAHYQCTCYSGGLRNKRKL